MYATFEEFIDHQQSPEEGSSLSPGQEVPPPPAPSGGLGTSVTNKDDGLIFANISSTMTSVPPLTLKPSTTRSLRLPSRSPPTISDDLAVTSPRRSRKRRSRRLRRSVDNPLLDTINSIGVGDSDEEPRHYRSHGHNLHHHHMYHHHSPSFGCCSRLHPETDSIGYAGSNSIDSGYKSACPTPDLSDAFYLDHRLEKRGSLVSLASSGSSGGSTIGSKPRIAMGTRVITRGGAVPRSPSSGFSTTSIRRLASDSSYYELDQLVALRQALLGSPTQEGQDKKVVTKPPITSAMAPRETHIPRSISSPSSPERRQRSSSIGSRYSPSTRGSRKACRSGSPMLSSTGSLPRSSSPARRLSLSPATREDNRAPPTWSRHSSPGTIAQTSRGRRPPSPLVGVDQSHENELAILEQEIDALLYGEGKRKNQSFSSENRINEYPRSYNSGPEDQESYRSSTGSFRRLKEEHQQQKGCSYPSDEIKQKSTLKTIGTSSQCINPAISTSVTKFPSSLPKFVNGDVTQCLLALLNDITCNMEETKSKNSDSSSVTKKRYRRTPFPREDYEDSSDSDSCTSCCSEYHLYEEIIYGDNKQCPVGAPRPPSPPPLPIRPVSLIKGFDKGNAPKSRREFPIGQNSPSTKKCYKCMCNVRMQRNSIHKNSKIIVSEVNNDLIESKRQSQKMAKLKSFFGESPPPTPPIRTTSQQNFICQKTKDAVQNKSDGNLGAIKSTPLKEKTNQNIDLNLNTRPIETVKHHILEGTQTPIGEQKPQPPPKISLSNEQTISYINAPNERTDELNPTISILPSHSGRPKQRNNIYSIFKERHCRRFVSASLEKEVDAAQLVTLTIPCGDKCPQGESCSTNLSTATRPNDFQSSSLSVNPGMKSSLTNNLSLAANFSVNTVQPQIASDVSSNHIPKSNDELLQLVKPKRIGACSLDANQHFEDDYGFYPLPHIV